MPKTQKTKLSKPRRGFTLIITITLMVLLTLIGIGLLSLSSVTLRASNQADSMSVARANSRMALILAINELQKSAGPDQRITARSDILGENLVRPRLTGVWKSRNPIATPPTTADYSPGSKKGMFLNWLVSTANSSDATNQDFANTLAKDPIRLWDKGTLGNDAPQADLIEAGKMLVTGSNDRISALAWAVSDEGIKARINTPYDKAAVTDGAKTAQLGSGERAGVEFMSGLDGLSRDKFEVTTPTYASIKKGITSLNSQLAASDLAANVAGAMKQHTHDLTAYSTGLFVDVATGGLKEDFQTIMENTTLPAAYASKGVYASRLGMSAVQAPGDPRWESFFQYGRLYRDKVINSSGVPLVKAQTPNSWVAGTVQPDVNTGQADTTTVNKTPPAGMVIMPSVAKVQVLFSLQGNDTLEYPGPIGAPVPDTAPQLHNPQGNYWRGTPFHYELDLEYTPVITLHNPYNVAMEFSNMKVVYKNVPFAAQIYRNGVAQCTDGPAGTGGLVPIDQMFFRSNELGLVSKKFGISLKSKGPSGQPDSTTIRLLPGEVKTFAPYLDPNHTWYMEHRGNRIWWDFDSNDANNMTQNIVAIPGWRGHGTGFVLDWWNAAPWRIGGPDKEYGRWAGCIGMARNDQMHVRFAPRSVPNLCQNKFTILLTADMASGSSTTATLSKIIEVDYENPDGMQTFLYGAGGSKRYPKTGTVTALDIVDHSSTPLKERVRARPFALLTVQAKTTYGAFDADKRDGRHAAKPWSFAHAVSNGTSGKVISEHPANHAYELDLIALEKQTDVADLIEIDGSDRSNFISGHTSQKGAKFGVMYDIPLAPVQTLASLNGVNPGGSSGFLPRIAQPIGNSWACPMMSPSLFKEAGAASFLNDHAFLLNMALYDRFYFSGLATQVGAFSTGKNYAQLVSDFSKGTSLTDPRMALHLPDGAKPTDMSAKLAAGNANRYAQVAAWQKMNGAFNINSTSVSAWKAMLASIHSNEAIYNKITGINTSALTKLPATGSTDARISRLRLPVSAAGEVGAFWLGPRELYEGDLDTLATEIVKQVRSRGPFLSMAEFVNRQLGTDAKAQNGALQQAIELSKINQKSTPEAKLLVNQHSGYNIDAAKVATYKYKNATAGTGSSAQGAPGAISQADLLNVLGNAATPRSDTFTIRAYGEARDSSNKITAVAYCEAVIQRQPEYVDPADPVYAMIKPPPPSTTTNPILTSTSNINFGRKMKMMSFRWLAKDEV